jgi:hypothetical protein
MAQTAKEWKFGKTPKEVNLKGDKRNPESAEHIITFPGGSFSVTRTSKNEYWVHIYVNKEKLGDIESQSKTGKIVCDRIDRQFPNGTEKFELPDDVYHVAFLIATE